MARELSLATTLRELSEGRESIDSIVQTCSTYRCSRSQNEDPLFKDEKVGASTIKRATTFAQELSQALRLEASKVLLPESNISDESSKRNRNYLQDETTHMQIDEDQDQSRGRSRQRKEADALAKRRRKPNEAFGRRNLRSPIPHSSFLPIDHSNAEDASSPAIAPRLAILDLSPRSRRHIAQLAQLYASLISAGCMPCCEAELDFLFSVLVKLERFIHKETLKESSLRSSDDSSLTNTHKESEASHISKIEKKVGSSLQLFEHGHETQENSQTKGLNNAAEFFPSTVDSWVHFVCVVIKHLDSLLTAFGAPLLNLLTKFQTLRQYAAPVVHKMLLSVESSSSTEAVVDGGIDGVGLAQPFRAETDSRLHFQKADLSRLFINRETTRDHFLGSLRKFEALQTNDSEQKNMAGPAGISNSLEVCHGIVTDAVAKCTTLLERANTHWFAQLFVVTMMQVCTDKTALRSTTDTFFQCFVKECNNHLILLSIENVAQNEVAQLSESNTFGEDAATPGKCVAHLHIARALGRLLGTLGCASFAWIHDPVFQERSEALSTLMLQASDVSARAQSGSLLLAVDSLKSAQQKKLLLQTVPWTTEMLRVHSQNSVIWANSGFRNALCELAKILDCVRNRTKPEQLFIASEIEALFNFVGDVTVSTVVKGSVPSSELSNSHNYANIWSGDIDYIIKSSAFANGWPCSSRLCRQLSQDMSQAELSHLGSFPKAKDQDSRILQAEVPLDEDTNVQRALATAFLHRNPRMQRIVDFTSRLLSDGFLEDLAEGPGHDILVNAVTEALQKYPAMSSPERVTNVACHKAADALISFAQDSLRGPVSDLVRASCASQGRFFKQNEAICETTAAISLSQACDRISFALQARLPRVVGDLISRDAKQQSHHRSHIFMRSKPTSVFVQETVQKLQQASSPAMQLNKLRESLQKGSTHSIDSNILDQLNQVMLPDIMVLDV